MIRHRTSAILALLGATACDGRESPDRHRVEPPVAFDTAVVVIRTDTAEIPLRVEVAETEAQRQYGLMERASLPPDRGMLFVLDEPADSTMGFYMYRTLIPLDIAFLDGAGTIRAILEMEPCEHPNPLLCRLYSPGIPYAAALEVNRGFFDRQGIRIGDRVRRLEVARDSV